MTLERVGRFVALELERQKQEARPSAKWSGATGNGGDTDLVRAQKDGR